MGLHLLQTEPWEDNETQYGAFMDVIGKEQSATTEQPFVLFPKPEMATSSSKDGTPIATTTESSGIASEKGAIAHEEVRGQASASRSPLNPKP